jgi:hypothetical protein
MMHTHLQGGGQARQVRCLAGCWYPGVSCVSSSLQASAQTLWLWPVPALRASNSLMLTS